MRTWWERFGNNEAREFSRETSDPALSKTVGTSFMLGMGKVRENVRVLLDVGRVLTPDALGEMTSTMTPDEARAEPETTTPTEF